MKNYEHQIRDYKKFAQEKCINEKKRRADDKDMSEHFDGADIEKTIIKSFLF